MTLVIVSGSRPEFIKLGAVAAELKALGVIPRVVSTGQHTDLLKGTPAETDLAGATSLGLVSDGNVVRWLESAARPLHVALSIGNPSLVVVQGDTMSALAGARAADGLGIPVAHIEAGIRSGTLIEPFPEEGFRREITQLATWHYAATSHAVANLRREEIPTFHVKLTGNPIVSAIARYSDAKPQPASIPHWVLITLHRRELLLSPTVRPVLQALAFALAAAEDFEFLWPIHPAMRSLVATIEWPQNVKFAEPMAYRVCVETLARCFGVITDSGGLQEEAATLGVPCIVLRNVTDRPESLSAGIAKLIPPQVNRMQEVIEILKSLPRKPCLCFGTPSSASLIAYHVASLVDSPIKVVPV